MKIKKHNAPLLEGDMTPMIDMAFQLVAFLMVMVNFTADDVSAKVVLPESALAKPPTGAPPEHRIIVQIAKDGTIIMGTEEYSKIEGFKNMMAAEKTVLQNRGVQLSEAVIYVRAHKDCPTGKVQEVIKECQLKSFERFILRAQEKS